MKNTLLLEDSLREAVYFYGHEGLRVLIGFIETIAGLLLLVWHLCGIGINGQDGLL